jgi:hypothetical protein
MVWRMALRFGTAAWSSGILASTPRSLRPVSLARCELANHDLAIDLGRHHAVAQGDEARLGQRELGEPQAEQELRQASPR